MSQKSVGIDFTLETVQYKFATIIGELCGKPSVLSQFAVWLDLRLAEYKLKGSISLDCSGLKPDPDWLQGLKDTPPPREQSPRSTATDRLSTGHQARSGLSKDRSLSNTTSYGTGQHSSQGSPEVMVIKEEPGDESSQIDQERVFPVGLHENNLSSRMDRKRQIDNSMIESSNVLSPAKCPRFSSTIQQSSHDSLSDSPGFTSQDQSISHFDDSELEQFIQGSNHGYNRGHNSASYMDQEGNNSAEFFSGTVLMDNSESAQPVESQSSHSAHQQRTASSSETGCPPYQDQGSSCYSLHSSERPRHSTHGQSDLEGGRESWHSLRTDKVSPTALSYKTKQNIAGAVASFWRWSLSQINLARDRELYEIPPEELDGYLAEFFKNAKKPNEFGVLGTSWNGTDPGSGRMPATQHDHSVSLDSGLDSSEVQSNTKHIRSSYGQRPKVINSTVRNACASRSLFERWLQSSNHSDSRHLEEIPPAELDQYLAEFFTGAKKRNGQDYDVSSLRRIRCGLQFYLRESGYQCSIIRSPLFTRSTEAIKIRCQELLTSSNSNSSNLSTDNTALSLILRENDGTVHLQ